MLPEPVGKTSQIIHCMDPHTQMHCAAFHQLCQETAALRLMKSAAPVSLSFAGMQSSEVLLR